MAKIVITADQVREACASGALDVPVDALVTPLAKDVAAELGVTIIQSGAAASPQSSGQISSQAPGAAGDLSDRVRAIVTSLLGSGGGGFAAPTVARRPVKLSSYRDAPMSVFPYPGPPAGMEVKTGDVVTGDDGAPMAAGYMTLTKGDFPWTLTYDEIQIVLEGELRLGGDAGNKVGHPGDVFYVPKGSSITFGTPNWTKFIYVTFPAEWEDQIG